MVDFDGMATDATRKVTGAAGHEATAVGNHRSKSSDPPSRRERRARQIHCCFHRRDNLFCKPDPPIILFLLGMMVLVSATIRVGLNKPSRKFDESE